tara:strand:+ start:3368 stop:3784 length:417 start_codon:yes stop_codon:yes gene_type:complete
VPVQRVSLPFKDISATFQINPISRDLIALKNENAIARSIRNLIFTVPGDIPFQPNIGCKVSEMLFENNDVITIIQIKSEIEFALNRFEPRIRLESVDVEQLNDINKLNTNDLNVTIRYYIIGKDLPTQELNVVLVPTR